MAQPYIGEIRMFAGSFEPAGWAFCHGQLLAISENETLFQLIGTTYGGDGQSTFALPDLRGRVPIHQGNSFVLAARGGVETVTLTVQQVPAHTHPALGSSDIASTPNPANRVLATLPTGQAQSAYGTDPPVNPLDSGSVAPAGGSQPHDNLQPFMGINYILSLFGIFPSQN
jgi:microcystin-dependent protein